MAGLQKIHLGIEKKKIIRKFFNFNISKHFSSALGFCNLIDQFKTSNIVELTRKKTIFRRWVWYGLSSKYACYFKPRVLCWRRPTCAFIAYQNSLLRLRKWRIWEGHSDVLEENVDFFHREHDKTHLSNSQGLSRGRMSNRQVKLATTFKMMLFLLC